jgi:carbonic anhydrase
MRVLKELFENNRAWAKTICEGDPAFFQKLSQQQSPAYLWIGCSDSRVPANQIVGLPPGQIFVHRNLANVVEHTDLNCLSVLQFAVDVLKVTHVIVCGHYGCAGVQAAQRGERHGLADEWLRHVRKVREKHATFLATATDDARCIDRLCELNVIEQVMNVCHTQIAQAAWTLAQPLAVHGWIYGIEDGLLRDLDVTVLNPDEISAIYTKGISRVTSMSKLETANKSS